MRSLDNRFLDFGEDRVSLAEGALLLRGFVGNAEALLQDIETISRQAPFRHLTTRRGYRMSVAMTNCGQLGWVSDRSGYRYTDIDPLSGTPWPPLPHSFQLLARHAAEAAGYPEFIPDACLINCYTPGTRLSLHQDRDERDLAAPIVSVSLGLPAVFQWGGLERGQRTVRLPVFHGDVLVWGGPSRLNFHGIAPLKDGTHELTGNRRFNITFRRAH